MLKESTAVGWSFICRETPLGDSGMGSSPSGTSKRCSIFSPSPARCRVAWLQSSEALTYAFNFKHRSNPADFIRAAHTLKDLADLEKESSARSRTKSCIPGHDLAESFSISIFPAISGSKKTRFPPGPAADGLSSFMRHKACMLLWLLA